MMVCAGTEVTSSFVEVLGGQQDVPDILQVAPAHEALHQLCPLVKVHCHSGWQGLHSVWYFAWHMQPGGQSPIVLCVCRLFLQPQDLGATAPK